MTPTTYGYRTIDTGDPAKGTSGWFASINFNTSRLDSHNHDGNNSALLSLSSFSPYTGTVSAGSWSSSGSGYRQLVTVPAGVDDVNNYNLKFVFTAPVGMIGQNAYLNFTRVSATTYYLYCNDNTAAFTVYYR